LIPKDHLKWIVNQFDQDFNDTKINEFGSGLINKTFLIIGQNDQREERLILQQINKEVFYNPPLMMKNIHQVAKHLSSKNFHQKTLQVIPNKNGEWYIKDHQNEYWRIFPFIENTFVVNEIKEANTAYEGAKAFGDFLGALWDMKADTLHTSIPDFHHTALRFQHFTNVVLKNPSDRNNFAKAEIAFLQQQAHLSIKLPTKLPIRVTHNDTKINNVLFDRDSKKGISVIDWDTLMPGWIAHDFGDMVRTFTNSLGEESDQLSSVFMNIDFFKALSLGFMETLAPLLTSEEKKHLVNGALVITFEQAVRFLSDYLQGDIYYRVESADHNLVRARNQIQLLKSMLNQQAEMEDIIRVI